MLEAFDPLTTEYACLIQEALAIQTDTVARLQSGDTISPPLRRRLREIWALVNDQWFRLQTDPRESGCEYLDTLYSEFRDMLSRYQLLVVEMLDSQKKIDASSLYDDCRHMRAIIVRHQREHGCTHDPYRQQTA